MSPLARWAPPWARVAAAAGSGLALALSFPPVDLAWLGPPAVGLLTLAVWRASVRVGFLLGLLQGLVFFGVLVRWLAVVGPDAWLLLAAYCALWIGAVGAAAALLTRLRLWPVWIACAWVLQEALRDRVPLGGFPWGRLAYGQTATTLTPYAALGGAPLVTFATALLGGLLAWLVLLLARGTTGSSGSGLEGGRGPAAGTAPPRVALAAAAVAAVAALLVGAGPLIPLPTQGQTVGGPAEVVAAVVQGNVPGQGLDAFAERRAVLDNHVSATIRLAAQVAAGEVPAPQLVVWPENATDIDPDADPTARAAIDAAVKAIGVPVLVGAVVAAPGDPSRVVNVGIVWDPVTGPGQRYAKVHPVPFGEFVPLRSVLTRFIGRFALVPRDFAAGSEPGVLTVGPARVGDVICFEVAYDEVVRAVATGGGRLLVVQTNNATYARTGQPEQQLAMSRLRAVEHGRAVLVAATSGISAVIAPDGTVLSSAPEQVQRTLVAEVPLRDDLTVSDRGGHLVEWLLAAGAVLGLVRAARRRGIGSGDAHPPAPAPVQRQEATPP